MTSSDVGLSIEEQACNFHTMRHIERVRNLLNICCADLQRRGEMHDQSKLEHPEVGLFTKFTPILAGLTFGSAEYDEAKRQLGPALEHHYANNRHHPEHFKDGIRDMNLLDLIEMFVDWKAASERHNNGNLRKSIEHNGKRFNMTPELIQIFENTVELLETP